MGRTAEYSVKGYVYQFLQYLHELITANSVTSVTIEGAMEDIDIDAGTFKTAVQCKYHETVEKYSLAKIYKPVLLMLEHHANNPNPPVEIRYQLFCHFPNQTGDQTLTVSDLETILNTKNKGLKEIVDRIPAHDLAAFAAKFSIRFGQSYADLEASAIKSLVSAGFGIDDVRSIIYPAAIQRIVDVATKSTLPERTLTRDAFLGHLNSIKHVTLTRWTRELSTKAQIFKRLQANINASMSPNARRRVFLIDPTDIRNFSNDFPRFLKRYVEKYNFKYLHTHAPTFIIASGDVDIDDVTARLYDIKITAHLGIVGKSFRAESFFSEPVIARGKDQAVARSFHLRLAAKALLPIFDSNQHDDLFLINCNAEPWNIGDINLYIASCETIAELEYLLKLRASYD